MMLTFLTPVFAALPASGKGRIALTLCIPVAANIGGIATPIGTPPNAIAVQALNDTLHMSIGFGQWMMVMFPFVILMLFISWFIIKKLFPFSKKTIELDITGNVHKGWRMWVVSITFIVTILMWLLDRVTGVDANTVALIPMGVFAITGVITARDLQSIDWSVIWMVAGGFALGLGLNSSGLAAAAIDSIPFAKWSPLMILIASGLICYVLSNFISNTAAAALLVPILAVVCKGMGDSLNSHSRTSRADTCSRMYWNGRLAWLYRWYQHYHHWYCFVCIKCHVPSYFHTSQCHCILDRTCKAERHAENRTYHRCTLHGDWLWNTISCRHIPLVRIRRI